MVKDCAHDGEISVASESPLLAIVGPTASGKSALALHLAESFAGEIISCDSVAIYRGLDIGSAKADARDRARVPHHGLDLLGPDQPATAGDYARAARIALCEIKARGRLPILVGGTGLYLRATLDGLAPAPERDEGLRIRLRAHEEKRGHGSLHRVLRRLDTKAADTIHPHDVPKIIRSLEVTLLGRQPQTDQWQAGREALTGFEVFRLGLDPPRQALYERVNKRAAAMFASGLLEETAEVADRYGDNTRALGALGYAQALAVLRGKQSLRDAVAEAQQGHRRYAKRQLTWFRRDPRVHWLQGFGDSEAVQQEAGRMVRHLIAEGSIPA